MPRGGKNHAQGGGGNRSGGEKIFARASRAQDSIFLPPWPILVVRPFPPPLHFPLGHSRVVDMGLNQIATSQICYSETNE